MTGLIYSTNRFIVVPTNVSLRGEAAAAVVSLTRVVPPNRLFTTHTKFNHNMILISTEGSSNQSVFVLLSPTIAAITATPKSSCSYNILRHHFAKL
jgi:hypothetical protein